MSEEEDDGEKEKEQAEPETADDVVPQQWKEKPIQDWVDQGWRPRLKRVGNVEYITMRKGRNERSLGRFSEERWSLLHEMFPKLKILSHSPDAVRPLPTIPIPTSGLLAARLARPQGLSDRIGFTTETLHWFEWAKQKKYSGSLGDFVSEIVHEFFLEHGLQVVAVIDRGVGEAQ